MGLRRLWLSSVIVLVTLLLVACSGEKAPASIPGCEDAPRPIVFVHGFMGGGDNFGPALMRFASNGYCPAYLRVFDWNTLSFDMQGNTDALSKFVDGVLKETGATKIDLVGHSMGGYLSYLYLRDHTDQVAHYVHAASFCGELPGSIPLLALLGDAEIQFPAKAPVLVLSSDEDTIVGPCKMAEVENQDIDGADHLQMVTLPQVFEAMYRFFNAGLSPATTDILPEEHVTLAGKVLSIGTGQASAGATVSIYPVDLATGERQNATPAASFTIGADGAWGPFAADPTTFYEFQVAGGGPRPFHYYRQPFPRSNPVVYLRTLPENDLLLSRVLGDIPYSDASSILILFSANQALYYGRDTATLDGANLVTPEMAPPPPDPASTIAIFILDADGDGQSDGGPVPGPLAEFPFFQQYDAFLDAEARRTIRLTLNGAALNVPAWKGDSQGVTVVVFDWGGP